MTGEGIHLCGLLSDSVGLVIREAFIKINARFHGNCQQKEKSYPRFDVCEQLDLVRFL